MVQFFAFLFTVLGIGAGSPDITQHSESAQGQSTSIINVADQPDATFRGDGDNDGDNEGGSKGSTEDGL